MFGEKRRRAVTVVSAAIDSPEGELPLRAHFCRWQL